MVALPLMTLAAPAYAEVKTREKSQVKFEGMLGKMFNLFGGKSAKEGVESRTAVKGNRKATLSDNGGTIVDLTEEKVYELDAKKKRVHRHDLRRDPPPHARGGGAGEEGSREGRAGPKSRRSRSRRRSTRSTSTSRTPVSASRSPATTPATPS